MTERKVGKRKKKKVNKINTLRSGGKLKSNFGDIAIMKNKKIHELNHQKSCNSPRAHYQPLGPSYPGSRSCTIAQLHSHWAASQTTRVFKQGFGKGKRGVQEKFRRQETGIKSKKILGQFGILEWISFLQFELSDFVDPRKDCKSQAQPVLGLDRNQWQNH